MKPVKLYLAIFTLLAVGCLVDCSRTSAKSPEVSDSIRKSLDQAGVKGVSVSHDRDKGVVPVVADQIVVLPPGRESDTKTVNSDLDKGIEKNLDAALIQYKLQKAVKYEVKSGL